MRRRTLIAVACGQADRWVIVKRGMYYRPKACGYTYNIEEAWIVTEDVADNHVYPRGDEPVTKRRAPLLDYFSDLNACHELHSALTPDQRTEFGWNLYKQVVAQDDASISYSDWIENGNELSVHSLFAVADASASQRAEAFGQTLKLW